MTACCPFCGAEYALTDARCWECKIVLPKDFKPTLVPEDGAEEVLYELDDWPVGSRVELTSTLAQQGIPSRWEPGLTLAVREVDDEGAERALDELEESFGEAGDEGSDDDALFAGEADDSDDDGGAVAQAAMADLFVAADRLMHEPDDESVAGELRTASTVVGDSRPPFGIEDQMWTKVQELSTAVCSHLDAGGEPDAVSGAAHDLRELLRDYV